MTDTANSYAAKLAGELYSAGELPAECGPAFYEVAREHFIPGRIWVQHDDDSSYKPIDRSVNPGLWLKYVYSNRVIVTQFDDGGTEWPKVGYRPTSSASMPSAVAGMLGELGAQPGESVCEIGTGTGFNSALLAEMVGSNGPVFTVEIDPVVAAAARDNLDRAGYSRVVSCVSDATTGDLGGVFQRVIATAGIHLGQLPYSWVASTKAGGVILAPMRTDMASGPLVKFSVDSEGCATGHAVRMRVGFMEVRSHRVRSAPVDELRWDDDTTARSQTDHNPFEALLSEAPRWAIAVAVPSCRYSLDLPTTQRRHGIAWLTDPLTGSWASIVPGDKHGTYTVRQAGPRGLWDEAERALRWWSANGEPVLEDWVWTVTPERQTITLS